jgi:hypothetical protein
MTTAVKPHSEYLSGSEPSVTNIKRPAQNQRGVAISTLELETFIASAASHTAATSAGGAPVTIKSIAATLNLSDSDRRERSGFSSNMVTHDSPAPSTAPQRSLADYCQWWPLGTAAPCYAPAGFVLVRLSGETLRFSCSEHLPAWANQIQGAYLVLERAEWEARGAGYRGKMLGG